MVKTSVFGRRTFPDLRPINGWQVTILWLLCTFLLNCSSFMVYLALPFVKEIHGAVSAAYFHVRSHLLSLRPKSSTEFTYFCIYVSFWHGNCTISQLTVIVTVTQCWYCCLFVAGCFWKSASFNITSFMCCFQQGLYHII